jgi:hypothetical protein
MIGRLACGSFGPRRIELAMDILYRIKRVEK